MKIKNTASHSVFLPVFFFIYKYLVCGLFVGKYVGTYGGVEMIIFYFPKTFLLCKSIPINHVKLHNVLPKETTKKLRAGMGMG